MHPALNYRQSRRSACDRCRGFKLRCKRDQVSGRSCERCLKAQVICTTSLSHSTSAFPSSKANAPTLPSEYEERHFFGHDRLSMSALRKPTPSRVQKSVMPSGILRRHGSQNLNSWREFDPCSYMALGPNNFALSLQSSTSLLDLPEQWHDANLSCDFNFQTQPIDLHLLDLENQSRDQLPFSDGLITNEVVPSMSDPFAEPHYSSEEDVIWKSTWGARPISAGDDDLRTSTEDWNLRSPQSTQKRLLKLNLELVEDLELLEWESTSPLSTPFLGDNMNTISKLDIPVFRMLNHSTRLLEILESERQPSDSYTAICFPSEPIKAYSHIMTQPPNQSFTIEEIMEDGIATVSPQDTNRVLPPRNRLPLFLSILTTYCHLIRLYHAIFTQLYQMFLIIPPPNDSKFLLLPNSQYGQIGMDGTLTVQIQVIIELSFNMLAKLEHALELESDFGSESDRSLSSPVSILDNTSLAVVREQIVAHEGIISGIPLRETMNCLSQLVKASAEP